MTFFTRDGDLLSTTHNRLSNPPRSVRRAVCTARTAASPMPCHAIRDSTPSSTSPRSSRSASGVSVPATSIASSSSFAFRARSNASLSSTPASHIRPSATTRTESRHALIYPVASLIEVLLLDLFLKRCHVTCLAYTLYEPHHFPGKPPGKCSVPRRL